MDEKNAGLREEPVSRPKALLDPSPRTNSAFVKGEGSPTLNETDQAMNNTLGSEMAH